MLVCLYIAYLVLPLTGDSHTRIFILACYFTVHQGFFYILPSLLYFSFHLCATKIADVAYKHPLVCILLSWPDKTYFLMTCFLASFLSCSHSLSVSSKGSPFNLPFAECFLYILNKTATFGLESRLKPAFGCCSLQGPLVPV